MRIYNVCPFIPFIYCYGHHFSKGNNRLKIIMEKIFQIKSIIDQKHYIKERM